MSYVYIRPYFTEKRDDGTKRRIYDDCFIVGFYDPTGEWHAESDHATREQAAKRVAFLNGGASLETGEEVPV